MGLNKQQGNMYFWITHTWNVVKGKCPHDCVYCYMKVYPQKELYFDEKALNDNLGQGNKIFVGSSCDMWASNIDQLWIAEIISKCRANDNWYLFQSKNPARFNKWKFPKETMLGITLESNRCWNGSKAPCPPERYYTFRDIDMPKMVSIEPIMNFDLEIMVDWIIGIKPEFVSIGADSKGHNLPEPTPEKVHHLIEQLQKVTTVKIKDNLKRLLK